MAKVLKTVGKIVTIAAVAVGTIATGGLLLAGAPLFTAISTGFGAVIGGLGVSASTLLAAGAVTSAIGGAIAGAPRLEETGADDRGRPFVDAGAVGAYVFGETAAPLALVFEENHGAQKELVSNVLAHAWHKIDSYQSLHVDGELVSFSGSAATGAYAGVLTWHQRLGDSVSQTAISLVGTLWPATAAGLGVAHSAMVWSFKDKAKLSGGVPNNLVVKIRGALMYDPRLDTTAGGAGTHRYDDPTTWTYNAGNAALVALRYIIGERAADGRLIWGVGEAQTDVDLASFIAAANVADEIRDGVARYNLAGFWPTSNDHEGFFRTWEANTGGKITRIAGRRYIWLPHDDLIPIATLTDKDIISGAVVTLRAATPIEQLTNTARGRYISAADLFQGAPYPEVIESTAVADDGFPRVLELDFGWVQVVSQAERTARQAVRRSRFGRIWTLAVGWQGALFPVFSVLTLTIKETDDTPTLARVIDRTISLSGVILLTLQEENAAIYDDTIPLGTAPANSQVVNRLSRWGTVTPRYVDGTSVEALKPAAPGATRNNVTSGTATPTGGVNGDLYYETDAQAWWSRIGGVWQKVSDATAANIAAGIAGQGALATLNSADWQTQVAGAGKPVDNATRNNVTSGTATPTGGVNGDLYYETDAQAWWSRIGGVWQKVSDATAANVAAGIAGQGALATLNSADWQTQVAGSGKPANNADVTGQNTALDTANVSGLTAGILRTSSRVGLFNGFEDGAEFAEWSVPAGNTLASDADAFSGGKAGLIGYAGAGDPASDVFTGGVYLTIPTEIALAFAGRRVRVTVFAKKPAANAASEFAVAYSTNETGNSGWIRFAPTTAWAAFSFLYVVPAPLFGGADFLGIWADTSNAGKKTLIDHVVIQAFPLDIEIDALGTTNGPQEAGANKTETRIAAGFTGQGALATQNAANFDSDVVDGVTFRRTTANEKTGAGRAFGALLSSTRIAVGVLKEQQSGGTPRELPIGGAENAVRDGVAVNFSQAWSGPPIIRFEGGVSYDPAFTGKQEQVFTPLNLSTTGYTPSLRVKAIGSSVPQNERPFVDVGGTPRFQLEKNITAQDKNDTYVFNLSVNVTNCEAPPGEAQQGIIILGLYSRTVIGGGWTKRGVAALTSAGVHQASIIVDGLGIDAAFGVHVESFGPCGSTFTPAASSVSYDTGTTGGESSATPAGSADARGFLLGNQQGV